MVMLDGTRAKLVVNPPSGNNTESENSTSHESVLFRDEASDDDFFFFWLLLSFGGENLTHEMTSASIVRRYESF